MTNPIDHSQVYETLLNYRYEEESGELKATLKTVAVSAAIGFATITSPFCLPLTVAVAFVAKEIFTQTDRAFLSDKYSLDLRTAVKEITPFLKKVPEDKILSAIFKMFYFEKRDLFIKLATPLIDETDPVKVARALLELDEYTRTNILKRIDLVIKDEKTIKYIHTILSALELHPFYNRNPHFDEHLLQVSKYFVNYNLTYHDLYAIAERSRYIGKDELKVLFEKIFFLTQDLKQMPNLAYTLSFNLELEQKDLERAKPLLQGIKTAGVLLTIFKMAPHIGSNSTDDIEIISQIAKDCDICPFNEDHYLTLANNLSQIGHHTLKECYNSYLQERSEFGSTSGYSDDYSDTPSDYSGESEMRSHDKWD